MMLAGEDIFGILLLAGIFVAWYKTCPLIAIKRYPE